MKISIYNEESYKGPMKEPISVGRAQDDPWAEWDRRDHARWKKRKHIEKWLEHRIGKPFNDVYSEFCKKYPDYICGSSTRNWFKNLFVRGADDRYKSFVVRDGLINAVPDERTRCNRSSLLKPQYLWKQEFSINTERVKEYETELTEIFGKRIVTQLLLNPSDEYIRAWMRHASEHHLYTNLKQMFENHKPANYRYYYWHLEDILRYFVDWKYINRYFESKEERDSYFGEDPKTLKKRHHRARKQAFKQKWSELAPKLFSDNNKKRRQEELENLD